MKKIILLFLPVLLLPMMSISFVSAKFEYNKPASIQSTMAIGIQGFVY